MTNSRLISRHKFSNRKREAKYWKTPRLPFENFSLTIRKTPYLLLKNPVISIISVSKATKMQYFIRETFTLSLFL